MKLYTIAAIAFVFISSGFLLAPKDSIDDQLRHLLNDNHFDGKIQEELEKELERKFENINKVQVETVEVIDASGNILINQKINASQNTIGINLHSLKQGVYYIKVTGKDGSQSSEIISRN